MKTLYIKIIIVNFMLVFTAIAQAGLYVDGGLSYRRIDNVGGTGASDTISTTDIVLGYKDRLSLPLGFGHARDTYDIRGQYRKYDYSSRSDLNYTEWQFTGTFRKFLNRRWWLLFSGGYLLINTDIAANGLDRISLGVENGYRLSDNLLLTAGYIYRNTSYDNNDDVDISHGYSVGAKYDFGDFLSAFTKYHIDHGYIDSLGIAVPDTRITRTQAGILVAVNQNSALRLMYEQINDGTSSNEVYSTDFVLRY